MTNTIQFNLLPWREERRYKRYLRTRKYLIAACFLGLAIGAGDYIFEKIRLNDYDKALEAIKKENMLLEPKLVEKRKLDKLKKSFNYQIDTIESLQANRSSVLHMVEELSIANKQDLFLTEFSLNGGVVNISGIARNDAQVADLMKRLRASDWYKEPRLLEIKSYKNTDDEIKKFSITSELLLPGKKIEGIN